MTTIADVKKVRETANSPIRGLTEAEAAASRLKHGTNEIEPAKRGGFIKLFISNLNDPMIRILMIALGLNLLLLFRGGSWYESVGIAVTVFIAAFVSTLSEYGSEMAFVKLRERAMKLECRVMRDGEIKVIPIDEIVLGDIVEIEAGEGIHADGILIRGTLSVDQSSLTGESKECAKLAASIHNNAAGELTPSKWEPSDKSQLFRGSTVTEGRGLMLALRVGGETFYGGMAREMQEEGRESPLKLRLNSLAQGISILGYCAAILVVLADLFNLLVIQGGLYTLTLRLFLEQALHALTLGITVVVVAVPEGLPMMITVVLSSNMLKMQKDNVMVRKLVGIETAGSLNILFTDKTGTLTKGLLEVAEIFCADGKAYSKITAMKPVFRDIIDLSCRRNTSSSLTSSGKAVGGNSTDRALISFTAPLKTSDSMTNYKLNKLIPFDSVKKYSAASVMSLNGNRFTLIKGAPEVILDSCERYYDSNGEIKRADTAIKRELNQKLSAYASRTMRVLAIAAVEGDFREGRRFDKLVFVAFAALRDELRSSAKKSVTEITRAGIQTVMITGDNKETATAIAKECGLVPANFAVGSNSHVVLTSDDMSKLSDHALTEILPSIRVVARALPSDKSRLVRVAQERGLVAGMTGDGLNDAPALKRSDVGFAMGSGTEVAKEAGDIIILDNNIASIVKAIHYGRTIFKSIRKFIVFQLTMNFCAVGVSLICPFLGFDTPVTVIQMLWINIIMDTLAGLAFAGEPPLPEYMREPPKKRGEHIFNLPMAAQVIFAGVYTVALCIYFLNSSLILPIFRYSPDGIYLMTGFFALFIFCGIFNSFNARTLRLKLHAHLFENKAFIIIILIITFVQLLLIYFGGTLFRCAPLSVAELRAVLLLAATVIPADLIRKTVMRVFGARGEY